MLTKRQPIRSKAILDSARDESCTICDARDGTVVACHINAAWAGKGLGQKSDDLAIFYGCFKCHQKYDSPRLVVHEDWEIMRAMYRTIRKLYEKGLITIK